MKEITEDYVSWETAKLLKENGFESDDCHTAYDENGQFFWHGDYSKDRKDVVDAPTLQMAMKWLMVNYNIHIEPRYFPMPNIYRYVIIHSPTTIENIDSHPQYFNSYEEACEAAIKYCLENLI